MCCAEPMSFSRMKHPPPISTAVADKLLRDVMKSVNPALEHVPFGGKVFELCGDFRQTLPVVKHGSQADIGAACINASRIWYCIRKFHLTQHMRVLSLQGKDAEAQRRFARYCLDVGEDKIPSVIDGPRRMIPIPADMLLQSATVEELYFEAYGRDVRRLYDRDFITSRCVVTPFNRDVDEFNTVAFQHFPGEVSLSCCVSMSLCGFLRALATLSCMHV